MKNELKAFKYLNLKAFTISAERRGQVSNIFTKDLLKINDFIKKNHTHPTLINSFGLRENSK